MPDTIGVLLKTFCHHPLRISGRFLWMCVEFLWMSLDYLCSVNFGRRESLLSAKALWLQRSSRRLLRVLNVKSHVAGQIPRRGLLVSNHVSYLDILVIAAEMPATFVAKHEVMGWPLFGWFARMAGTIFVHRTKRQETVRATTEIKQALDAGALLVLFPEGTSSGGETVLPFKSALLEPAVQQGHELYTSYISYALTDGSVSNEVCYWRDMILLPHLLNLLSKRSISAFVRFSQLREGSMNRKDLARQLHAEVMRLRDTSAELKVSTDGLARAICLNIEA